MTNSRFHTNSSPVHVGLLPRGGRKWIAGVIYIHNILRAINLLPENERPQITFMAGPKFNLEPHQELKNLLPPIKRYLFHGPLTFNSYQVKLPFSLERQISNMRLKALFSVQKTLGKNFPVPWIGWIPDFQHKRLPQFFTDKQIKNRDVQFKKLVDDAYRVVVLSQDSYRGLMRWFPMNEEKVSVFPFTTVPDTAWYNGNPESIISRYNLPRKYLIFPSQFWAHKNHLVLFEAIKHLNERGFSDVNLVCTGYEKDNRFPEHGARLKHFIEKTGLKKQIHILGLLPRYDQIQLLRGAAAVVQPSLFEGWSALVEDSRIFFKRIYLSDIPVHREQKPENASFFHAGESEELADLIAHDWNKLKPGPDPAREQTARKDAMSRALEFAKSFMKIIEITSKNPE